MADQSVQSNFVELNRTFHEVSPRELQLDEPKFRRRLRLEDPLSWEQVLNHYRVILISKAGAGKTSEIRHVTEKLRHQGKNAFFLRLENISDDFEVAFEVGSFAEFETWLTSTDEGWMFLDSVDEAKLRHPRDFERAIRKFGQRIVTAHQRARVIITGRPEAWRHESDLALCREILPFKSSTIEVEELDNGVEEDSFDMDFQTVDKPESSNSSPFKIVALDDLDKDQIEIFMKWKGLSDATSFLNAIQRADAWEFTGRPQDLEELVDYWKDRQQIGSRLDIMLNSIDRRLRERDQGRDDSRPLSIDRARLGAKLIAAAATLGKVSNIRVPDGTKNLKGIAANEVLSDWTSIEVSTLLSRPIFEEAIYGSVRFHHRSVREYLAAEWLADLLKRETSRRRIESLIFRKQYGIDVVVPSMRPILPWLAILDEKICARLRKTEPEILLEDGDPSKLPVETRRQILHEVCDHLSAGATSKIYSNYSAVERFADESLAVDVKVLLEKYSHNNDLIWFLLRMVWQGEMREALPEVKSLASSASPNYTRIVAFRALRAIGSANDFRDVRERFSNDKTLNRELLAELLDGLEPTKQNVDWCIKCLGKVKAQVPSKFDELTNSLDEFFQRADVGLLPLIVSTLNSFLDRLPVIETKHCEVSQEYSWLLKPVAHAAKRLIEMHSPASLEDNTFDVLNKIAASHNSYFDGYDATDFNFESIVPAWSELNRNLFWYNAQSSKQKNKKDNNERPKEFWEVDFSFWKFEAADFDYFSGQINDRKQLYEKHLALSLAFRLYLVGGRRRQQRERLKKIVAAQNEKTLVQQLKECLKPPAAQSTSVRQMKTRLKRRSEAWEKKQTTSREAWTNYLKANVDKLRNNGLKPGQILNAQEYVHELVRSKNKKSNQWTSGNWKCVIEDFGEDVAKAYRDGVVAYWRGYRPELRSEGAPINQTSFAVIFGLTGILIEARENPDWVKGLNANEVELACRYASYELNGFPAWFPAIFEAHTSIVKSFLLQEIRHELSSEQPDVESHYILSDLSWSGQWAWNELGPALLVHLKEIEPKNLANLKNLLKILQGSSISDIQIAELASTKCNYVSQLKHSALWFATWVGVEASAAVPALKTRIKKLSKSEKTEFAMQFSTQLVGDRRESSHTRRGFRTPQHLKCLYLLMLRYIKVSEDIDRKGKGAYSPGLRDDAQRTRDTLSEMIREIPGKEAFIALTELADACPEAKHRPWFALQAKAKAETDADIESWTPTQVRDFHEKLERTPENHRDLADLVHLRLLDLKDDLENGDSSIAGILMKIEVETDMRKFIGRELRDKSLGRYSVPQEEELADAKRIDLRIHGVAFDGPVPCELKLSHKWSVRQFFERLENQLGGDYLRDNRSNRGFFILVHQGKQKTWQLPASKRKVDFQQLVILLVNQWSRIAVNYPTIDAVEIIGIDLTKRFV